MSYIPFNDNLSFTTHLVVSRDLNHHGTLYAGRFSEWCVEAAFTCAALLYKSSSIVCVSLNSLNFHAPIRLGEVVTITSSPSSVTTSSITIHVSVTVKEELKAQGSIVFVCVDKEGKKVPHNLKL